MCKSITGRQFFATMLQPLINKGKIKSYAQYKNEVLLHYQAFDLQAINTSRVAILQVL